MHRLGYLDSDNWIEYAPDPVYEIEKANDRTSRIVAAIASEDFDIFERLTSLLEPPFFLLYILHTPRGEGMAGRYQSPELSSSQVSTFLSRFRVFLGSDGRYDLWVHSPNEKATIVWDRHNQIYAYGPLSKFVAELREQGFSEGHPLVPSPHQHCYNSEFDHESQAILQALEWSYSPLQPQDEQ
ncbi:hypothetical protein [Geothrix limicola]|uniref:hypothetical protein n=1 Tax=Geothrix limicola TaxID=2927978 RepID=UPI0025576C0C|nr:hypothetical protein [Geothrix limicola]